MNRIFRRYKGLPRFTNDPPFFLDLPVHAFRGYAELAPGLTVVSFVITSPRARIYAIEKQKTSRNLIIKRKRAHEALSFFLN